MRLTWQSWLIISSLVQVCVAQEANNTVDLVCRPFGTCEPCPDDALNEPFCQPFGNRRLMHCSARTSSPAYHPPPGPAPFRGDEHDFDRGPPPFAGADSDTGQSKPDSGEIPAWEACGRIVEKERGDFYEFLACNVVIAVIALVVLFMRSKRLQAMHARQLAARIGLVRGAPGGWAVA